MKNTHGFNLVEEKTILDCHYRVFDHTKTRAKLLYVQNCDSNNLFGVGFRTPPLKDTGVTHILEHSVLNGSKKYKTKEPFWDMLKGSLQTFLNAMTFPDKTLYPVASQNEKDFHNLMDVYLDAVFNPRAIEDERIFRQEGWRYDLDDEKNIVYKGVVYNEMRGAMSSAEDQVLENISKELYRGTSYSYNSGGDPYAITTLTYEDFVNYYKYYYHPSNAYFFLYGNMDFEKNLEIIASYLENYQYKEIKSMPELLEEYEDRTAYLDFSVAEKQMDEKHLTDNIEKVNENLQAFESIENKEKENYMSFSVILGDDTNTIDSAMSNILAEILIDSEAASLKRRILDANISRDVFTQTDSNRQASLSIIAKNTGEDIDKFKIIIEDELNRIIREGFDKNLLRATLNKWEFSYRASQSSANRGLYQMINSFSTWLYDLSPLEAFDFENTIEFLKAGVDTNFYENYLKEKVLGGKKLYILHRAKPGLNAHRDKLNRESLDKKKKSMSREEFSSLEAFSEAFASWQKKENSEEELATIPKLDLKDVEARVERIPRKLIREKNATYLLHDLFTNGIDYISLSFNLDHIRKEDLVYVSLVSEFIGMLDTKNHSYEELSSLEYLYSGGINISPKLYSKSSDSKDFSMFLAVETRIIDEHEKSLDLIMDLLFNTDFSNSKRIKELLYFVKSRFEFSMFDQAHSLVRNMALSQFSGLESYNECLNGLEFYRSVCSFIDTYSEDFPKKLEKIYKKLFTADKLLIDLTSGDSQGLKEKTEAFVKSLPHKTYKALDKEFEKGPKKIAFSTSADVQYISKAADLNDFGVKYSGDLALISSIIAKGFLYAEIRAKGGAYGAGLGINWKNTISTYSYRDPNLLKTIDTYKHIGDFLKNLSINPDEFQSYIIGTIGNIKTVMSPQAKAKFDLAMYMSNRSYEDLDSVLKDILSAKLDDLKKYSEALEKSMTLDSLVVLGNKKVIEKNRNLFDEVIDLI